LQTNFFNKGPELLSGPLIQKNQFMYKSLLLILLGLFISCRSSKPQQGTTGIVERKNQTLPVYIYYKNTPPSDSVKEIIENLFKEHNIQTITKQEMLDMNDQEIKRAGRVVFMRGGSDAEQILKDIAFQQKYVLNILSIDFNYPNSISWQSSLSPFKMDRPTQGNLSVIGVDRLKDKSIREILLFLVGVILTSGELK